MFLVPPPVELVVIVFFIVIRSVLLFDVTFRAMSMPSYPLIINVWVRHYWTLQLLL